MIKIGRPNVHDAPSWYPYFFNLTTGNDLIEALRENQQHMLDLINAIPVSAEDYKYAENKWTIKQVFIHIADEERYYAYKAFCYARQVDVDLEASSPGEDYAKDFNTANRTLKDICAELLTVREATISLFSSMTGEMLDFKFPDKTAYTARSLGWMAVGHSLHHCNQVREKYFPQLLNY